MNRRWRWFLLGLCGLLAASCGTEVSEPAFDNPFDPSNTADIPAPDSIAVTVGDNLVRLTWGSDATPADEFAILRRRTDLENGPGAEELLARVREHQYADTGVRNDHSYEYRIAAGRNGKFGRRSDFIAARPGLFALTIGDGAPRTRNRSVQISLSAPGAAAVRLYEGPDSSTATWRQATSTISWTLSVGDGEKIVYGIFRLADGSLTSPASDQIILDTHALVRAVEFDGADTRQPGDPVHFRLDAAEPNGTATVDVAGVFTALPLFDDGTNGDATARDGMYERDALVPAGRNATAATVTGRFTDEAGNTASLDGARTLSVRESPEAVTLLTPVLAEPPDAAAVRLRWTQSLATDFSVYRVFRAQAADVDSSDRLVGSVSAASNLELTDSDVVEGDTHWYRVYVITTSGLQHGSNAVQATVTNLRSPAAVNVEAPDATGPTRVALRWSRCQDTDFQSYKIYRNATGAVTEIDSLIATITDADHTYHDDTGLAENRAYYYRVYVRDRGGMVSRSNEIKATTQNEIPPAVVLQAATEVDTTAATLTWSQSDAHDFAFYRLYRDLTTTVSTASERVVEIDARDAVSFRDTGLTRGKTYYYRVFVVDDGTNPGPKSAGSNTITVTTSSALTRKVDHDPER